VSALLLAVPVYLSSCLCTVPFLRFHCGGGLCCDECLSSLSHSSSHYSPLIELSDVPCSSKRILTHGPFCCVLSAYRVEPSFSGHLPLPSSDPPSAPLSRGLSCVQSEVMAVKGMEGARRRFVVGMCSSHCGDLLLPLSVLSVDRPPQPQPPLQTRGSSHARGRTPGQGEGHLHAASQQR
jgi:hypothetical protein